MLAEMRKKVSKRLYFAIKSYPLNGIYEFAKKKPPLLASPIRNVVPLRLIGFEKSVFRTKVWVTLLS